MILRLRWVLLALAVSFATLNRSEAAPELKFKKIKINGIDTYLIDTHRGNAMALTVNVQVGSGHDDPIKHAGRAHLWEHTIFLGSKKHPEHHEFDDLAPKVGGMHNAYTANDRTFYYFNQHPSSLALSTSLLGGMISEPIWNNTAFLKERENVKNEALDYQNRDDNAIFDMPFIHLSPKGHPLAMYSVGTQDQLNAMSLEDLRSLYNSFYRPEYMQIIVAGNFDTAVSDEDRLDEAKLTALLNENFKLTSLNSKPTEFKKDIPPIYPSDPSAPRMMEIGTASEQKILLLRFQATDLAHNAPFMTETVMDSLNLNTKGAITRILKDRGLVSGGGFGFQRLNNLTQAYASFELTEEGAKKRDLVMHLIFEALGDLQRKGLTDEVFDYLKRRNISSYHEMMQTPYRAAEHFAKFFDLNVSPDIAFDFEAQYGALSVSEVSAIASSLFSPERMIGAYLGNDVKGTEKCPVFGRSFTKTEGAESLSAWNEALEGRNRKLKSGENEIVLKRVPLKFSERPLAEGKKDSSEIKSKVLETKVVLQEDHGTADSALRAILLLVPAEIEDAMSRALFISAFHERYECELSYLDSLNLMRGVSAHAYELEISVKGNTQANRQALLWVFEKLREFVPTNEELNRARDAIIMHQVGSLDGFTAHTAVQGAQAALNQVGNITQEKIRVLRKLSNAQARKRSAKIFDRADIIVASSGDNTPESLNELASTIRTEVPKALRASERVKHTKWSIPINRHALLWAPLGDSKADDSYGHVRVFEGPKIGSEDSLIFPAFASAFGNAVYKLNRSERKLGYVHSASASPYDTNLRLSLVGQTDGLDNFPKIEQGWRELIDQVKDGSFPRQQLLDTIEGRRLTLLLKPSTQAEELDRMVANFRNYRDLTRREKELEALRTVAPEDLLEVGRKYLKSKNFLEVIGAKARPCKEAMKSLANLRRKLKKA